MKKIAHLTLIPLLILSGCSSSNDDLQSWMDKETANLKGKVQPIPAITPYLPESYTGRDLPDPFSPKKNLVVSAANAPDPHRKKEFLESFPLEQLSMSGSIMIDQKLYALIKAPDGTINKVLPGHYLGLNYGKILSVSPTEIKIREIIMDSAGSWSERQSQLETSMSAAANAAGNAMAIPNQTAPVPATAASNPLNNVKNMPGMPGPRP